MGGLQPRPVDSSGAPTSAKSYVLEMLPYPSGEPHIGHLKVYSVGDAVAHFHRRTGRRVLHPMGYDAFGLPAENHAIKTGQHPRESTRPRSPPSSTSSAMGHLDRLVARVRHLRPRATTAGRSGSSCSCSTPASRYRKDGRRQLVPEGRTVLANEQVIDGACERCGTSRGRHLEQWFFRITAYADRLLDDLDPRRLAGARRDDAAQLDRPQRGRRGDVPLRGADPARSTPSSPRARTRCSARPSCVLAPEHPRRRASHRRHRSRGGGAAIAHRAA